MVDSVDRLGSDPWDGNRDGLEAARHSTGCRSSMWDERLPQVADRRETPVDRCLAQPFQSRQVRAG
jgi:hypothetical protein